MTTLQDEKNDNFYNPYNLNNKEITLSELQTLLQSYGVNYKIDNISLYHRAFVHKSYLKKPSAINEELDIKLAIKPYNCIDLKTKSNERLEFLGDGVLELITKYYLYKRFPKADEGFMTEKKIALVKNENIGKLAYELKLNQWYIISKHSEEKNIRNNYKKLGCLFEAFIGALFLDVNKIEIKDENNWFPDIFTTGPGFQMAQIFIENIFEQHINWNELIINDDNYKNQLQVIIQKEFKTTPEYIEISNDQTQGYLMGVYLCLGQEIYQVDKNEAIDYKEIKSLENIHTIFENNKKVFVIFSKAVHKIKKKAEQLACEQAIKLIS